MFDSFRNSVENVADSFKSEAQIKEEIGDDMDRIMRQEVVPEAKRNAPYDTGELANSIEFVGGNWNDDVYVTRFGSNVEYAEAIENGAEPHEIWATDEPYLAFYWKREGVYFRGDMVNHPGNEPHKFMERALDDAGTKQAFSSSVKQEYEDAISPVYFD